VPVSISKVNMLELDQRFAVASYTCVAGHFLNGAQFTFELLSAKFDKKASGTVPRALQLIISGSNASGQVLEQVWALTFTVNEDCGGYQVLKVGDQMGWTRVVS
jgi:hypothetical protein